MRGIRSRRRPAKEDTTAKITQNTPSDQLKLMKERSDIYFLYYYSLHSDGGRGGT